MELGCVTRFSRVQLPFFCCGAEAAAATHPCAFSAARKLEALGRAQELRSRESGGVVCADHSDDVQPGVAATNGGVVHHIADLDGAAEVLDLFKLAGPGQRRRLQAFPLAAAVAAFVDGQMGDSHTAADLYSAAFCADVFMLGLGDDHRPRCVVDIGALAKPCAVWCAWEGCVWNCAPSTSLVSRLTRASPQALRRAVQGAEHVRCRARRERPARGAGAEAHG